MLFWNRPTIERLQINFRRFSGLFWPSFDPKTGDNIDKKYIAASLWIETRLKRTRKTTETYFEDAL